jgi:hypothetical protein
MQLIEVNNASLASDFIKVNVLMNKNNPNYIQPLNNEVNDVFDTLKNKNFKYGVAKRWILKDDNKLIGRIAAFIHSKYINKGTEFATGGIGFFIVLMIMQLPKFYSMLQKHGCKAKAWKQWTGP